MFKTINDDYRLKSAEKCEIPLVLAKVSYNDCEVKNIDDQKEKYGVYSRYSKMC